MYIISFGKQGEGRGLHWFTPQIPITTMAVLSPEMNPGLPGTSYLSHR